IGRATAALDALGWRCRTLIDCALHVPERAGLGAVFGTVLAPIRLRAPRPRVFSSIHLRELTTADELRAELVANVAVCYDFAAAVRELQRLGVTRFVDVGPGHVVRSLLTHFDPPLRAATARTLLTGDQKAPR